MVPKAVRFAPRTTIDLLSFAIRAMYFAIAKRAMLDANISLFYG
jgi:hypothetical protein